MSHSTEAVVNDGASGEKVAEGRRMSEGHMVDEIIGVLKDVNENEPKQERFPAYDIRSLANVINADYYTARVAGRPNEFIELIKVSATRQGILMQPSITVETAKATVVMLMTALQRAGIHGAVETDTADCRHWWCNCAAHFSMSDMSDGRPRTLFDYLLYVPRWTVRKIRALFS